MCFAKRAIEVLFATLLLALQTSPVSAAVVAPQLDIQTLTGDTAVTSIGGNLNIDATAISITTDSGPVDIPNEDFLLTATYFGSSGPSHIFTNGALAIGSLLTAVFDNLTMVSLGGGIGAFSADLTYTGGSLQGSFTIGRIEGTFFNATAADFSGDFSANTVIAKVGQVVVPLPGALLLFGSGLIGLMGMARRHKKMLSA